MLRQLYSVKARAEAELNSCIAGAKAEFKSLPESQQTQARKISIVLARSGRLYAMQASYDKEVESIVSQMRAVLTANGQSTALADQAMASVMSTVLSRLNAFLDTELEQVLCFDGGIDAEQFVREKCAIFLILPEEDATKNFVASLMIQNLAREGNLRVHLPLRPRQQRRHLLAVHSYYSQRPKTL